LAGDAHFEYAKASNEILAKAEKIKALCARDQIPIKAAALHFSLANPASAAVIPGASKPERIKEDHQALNTKVPETSGRNCVAPAWYRRRRRCPSTNDRRKHR
jgi:D-threo-aldose 1-dehydrogenase